RTSRPGSGRRRTEGGSRPDHVYPGSPSPRKPGRRPHGLPGSRGGQPARPGWVRREARAPARGIVEEGGRGRGYRPARFAVPRPFGRGPFWVVSPSALMAAETRTPFSRIRTVFLTRAA